MIFVGRRAVPWLLEQVARTGSRELFTLAVLAAALGIAVGAASLFGVSFALGAFLAGIVISESDLSHERAPKRPAAAGRLCRVVLRVGRDALRPRNPAARALQVLAVVGIVMVGKSLAALGIVLAFGYPLRTAVTIAASLGQVGEFSFILAALGVSLRLLPPEGRSLILAGALLSITLNPALFGLTSSLDRWLKRRRERAATAPAPEEM